MINPSKLLTGIEFMALSAHYKDLRRANALPQLNARRNALNHEIYVLRLLADWMGDKPTSGLSWKAFQSAVTFNHKRNDLLNAAAELGWEYQETSAQIAVIESEML